MDELQHTVTNNSWSTYTNMNNIYGQVPGPRLNTSSVTYLGQFKTSTECWAACNASMHPCRTWTFHELTFDPAWAGGCYTHPDGTWAPVAEAGVTSARGPATISALHFGRGGNQGGEGNDQAAEWFIENVMEELDAPNEFFYDNSTGRLLLVYNGSGTPPSNVVVPTLANIFELRGSPDFPVRNVTFQDLVVTMQRPTFLEPRGVPSGGDWALERMGALLLQGTEDVVIADCLFTQLESNAVFLSGYNRRTQILRNEFGWLGQNAIASWGLLEQLNDGTGGEQPRWTVVQGNFAHELGLIQKQSSAYFQAITALATLQDNIFFNLPRAAVNFNDGFGGGSTLRNNLLFNTCEESSDHGGLVGWLTG